jgi:cyclopropane fatty-acyl-phospholipid synthase-like methyltransferase
MTHWDDIYKNYQKGGEAWATLAEEIIPQFIAFVEEAHFPKKHALDIGCGTGKYMKCLYDRGFTVEGIDNSPTAIEMTKSLVPDAIIHNADMHDYEFAHDTYDFIFSISTIHHGMKDQVQRSIDKIYDALVPGGHILITFPDWENARTAEKFKQHLVLGDGVLAPPDGPEKGLPHCFYTEAEAEKLFQAFKNLNLQKDEIHRWIVTGAK